jgi:hypothetical protein
VTGRRLAAGWVATSLLVVAALGWTIVQTIALSRSVASADTERSELTRQLEAKRQRMQSELAAKIDLVKDTRWSSEKPSGADVLRRLADLARDGHAKVSAVAPVEKESGARTRESSHRVEMSASFHEILDFATRIERDGGLLEEVVLETPQKPGDGPTIDGLSAQFRLTTIEPSEDARRIMKRVLSASANSPKFTLTSALSLPVEWSQERTSQFRDPFRFAELPVRRRAPSATAAPSQKPVTLPITVKGIVKFPGGVVAIVNDQIVKVGDAVDGHRVESIADGSVVLHEPGSGSRSVPLAGFAAVPPAPLMRR